MHVSLLSQDVFASRVGALEYSVRETAFGGEVSLWNQNHLYALGFGEVGHVLEDLKSHFPSLYKYSKANHVLQSPQGLVLVGTPFQQCVWSELMKIPKGAKVTYQQIANAIGNPKAVRAVGSAIGRNPISLHVPCHRVIRSDGGLGGYRWGLDIKKKILENE